MYEMCESIGGQVILIFIVIVSVVLICVLDVIEYKRDENAKEYKPRGEKTDERDENNNPTCSGH